MSSPTSLACLSSATTNENIRIMQGEKCGAEILRLIVRDNLGGAALSPMPFGSLAELAR
jgi:hypothetical protein